MSSYYDDDDELDIRIHRGRVSPQPVIYPEHRRPARPIYYQHGSSYLEPQYSTTGLHRSRSTGHRQSPPPQPVIINKIYNDERYEDEEDDRTYLALAPRPRARSRSRSRAPSFTSHDSSRHSSRDKYELEKTRKELEAFKMKAEREEEAKRLKKELELERLRKEREEEEEKKRAKKEADEAVEKWKRKEAERIEKEKKEKEEREKEYQRRLEEDLRKAGMDDRQIAVVTKKEKAIDPNRPTFTRMSRKHLSIETLNAFKIDYEFDVDPNYVLIRRWVPEYEQDFLWNHTREIRERRQPVLVAIEGKKKHNDVEFEFVRKKEHKRKPSPSPLLTFLAGGKR